MIRFYSKMVEKEASLSGYKSNIWEFLGGSSHIPRINRNDPKYAKLDFTYKIFVDAGMWGIGTDGRVKSTFVVISQFDILLCSWLPMDSNKLIASHLFYCEQVLRVGNISKAMKKISIELQDFNKSRKAGDERGFVLAHARTSKQLTEEDKLIIVFPDLHLHLFYGDPVDRFVYKPSWESIYEIPSLQDELRSLIEIAEKSQAITVQVGDLYEIWESELILRLEYYYFLKRLNNNEIKAKLASDKLLSKNIYSMLIEGCFKPIELRFFNSVDKMAIEIINRIQKDLGVDKTYKVPISFIKIYDTEAIKDAIRNQYSFLFKGKKSLFTYEIIGNHDNNLLNKFWSKIAHPLVDEENEFFNNLRMPTLEGKNKLSYLQLGINDAIWFEHGHNYDWHNNDIEFWLEGRGFHWTTTKTLKTLIDLRNWFLTTDELGKLENFRRKIADFYADITDIEMRLYTLHRADVIFFSHKNVSVVIMGHTHSPSLMGMLTTYITSFLTEHPQWREYIFCDKRIGPIIPNYNFHLSDMEKG